MNLPEDEAEITEDLEPPVVPNDENPEDDLHLPDPQDQLAEEFEDEDAPAPTPTEEAPEEEAPKKRIYISEAVYYRYLYRYLDPTNAQIDTEELRRESTLST